MKLEYFIVKIYIMMGITTPGKFIIIADNLLGTCF